MAGSSAKNFKLVSWWIVIKLPILNLVETHTWTHILTSNLSILEAETKLACNLHNQS